MKIFYALSFLFFGLFSNGQNLLKGFIVNAETNAPLANASVFLNNTSTGTISNAQGYFQFMISAGRHELIVSMIGYETFVQAIDGNATNELRIRLKPKVEELATVVVEPYEKNGWQKWGRFFIESFIGTSANAANCKIKNTHVIKFRLSKNGKELTAFASEPLIIENNALGYTLQYQLENFQYSFSDHYLLYVGYPFFQPMKGNNAKQKRWQRARHDAYTGSVMHFMRAVFRNKVKEEGFEINALRKIPNTEKQRVKAVYSSNTRTENLLGRTTLVTINQDTAEYYNKVMRQPDYTNLVNKNLLTADSVAYAVDSITASLDFDNYLLVFYNKEAPPEYRRQFPQSNAFLMSEITLINQQPVQVLSNGHYYNPLDLMSTGYWAWSEKIATLLPFDYVEK